MTGTLLYKAGISAIDGVTCWDICTDSLRVADSFIKTYDHEGSVVVMEVIDMQNPGRVLVHLEDAQVVDYIREHL